MILIEDSEPLQRTNLRSLKALSFDLLPFQIINNIFKFFLSSLVKVTNFPGDSISASYPSYWSKLYFVLLITVQHDFQVFMQQTFC